MKVSLMTLAIAIVCCFSNANAQDTLPLPSPTIETIEPAENVVVDQEIVVDEQSGISTYQQQEDERQESYRERRTRIAQEKGDQRRARLAYQKAMGISTARPNVNPFAPMSAYTQTWFGGNTYAGPYNWVRKPSRHYGWPYGSVHVDYLRN